MRFLAHWEPFLRLAQRLLRQIWFQINGPPRRLLLPVFFDSPLNLIYKPVVDGRIRIRTNKLGIFRVHIHVRYAKTDIVQVVRSGHIGQENDAPVRDTNFELDVGAA